MCNFSSILIVFHQFFTWIALGDADLHFSLILVRKANAVDEETKWATWFYHQRNQSIHVTDGVKVTSLLASLLQKVKVTTNHLCQIMLNRKLLRTFDKCDHRSSMPNHVKPKIMGKLKSGVSFQVTLKQNRMKWELPVQASNTFKITTPTLLQ
jgi:hypothetical protein